jgi:hypothetical protein
MFRNDEAQKNDNKYVAQYKERELNNKINET